MADKRSLAFGFLGEDLGLGRTLKGLAKDSDHAHSSLSRLSKVAIGAGAVAGVTLLTKKVIDFGKDTVDAYTGAARSAGALQRVIGGTVEDASRLTFAAHEAGVSEESLGKSLRLLEKNLGAATKAQVVKTKHTHQEIVMVNRLKDGHIVQVKALKNVTDWTSKTIKVSKDLGFTYKDAHGKLLPMRDILLNVADRFQHMPNGVEKTALALKLFGRAGTDMIPILNKGRDGVKELMAESDKLGTTMSAKDVKAVKDYTEQQRHLHAAMDGLKITLGRELFPIFTAWSHSLATEAPKIIAWTKTHLPEFRQKAGEVARFIKNDLEPAVSHFVDGLVTEGGKIEKDVAPFFHWVGDHPDLFKNIAEDAVVLGGALKAKSFLNGLGLLKGLTPRKGGLAGSLASKAGAVPVFVTNPGFGPGGKGIPPIIPGAAAAEGSVIGLGGAVTIAVAGGVAVYETNKFAHAHPKTEGFWGGRDPISTALFGKHKALSADEKAKGAAEILKYGDPSMPAVQKELKDFGYSAFGANNSGDDKRAMQQQQRLTQLGRQNLSPAAKASEVNRITNTYYITVNGLTMDQAIAEAHRRSRIHALGSTNTPASRDRRG